MLMVTMKEPPSPVLVTYMGECAVGRRGWSMRSGTKKGMAGMFVGVPHILPPMLSYNAVISNELSSLLITPTETQALAYTLQRESWLSCLMVTSLGSSSSLVHVHYALQLVAKHRVAMRRGRISVSSGLLRTPVVPVQWTRVTSPERLPGADSLCLDFVVAPA